MKDLGNDIIWERNVDLSGSYPIYKSLSGHYFVDCGETKDSQDHVIVEIDKSLLPRYKQKLLSVPAKQINLIQISKHNFKLTRGIFNLFALMDTIFFDSDSEINTPRILMKKENYNVGLVSYPTMEGHPQQPKEYRAIWIITKKPRLVLSWVPKRLPTKRAVYIQTLNLKGKGGNPSKEEWQRALEYISNLSEDCYT
jgi:hypothetical protein